MKFIIPVMAALLATTSIAHAADAVDVQKDAQEFVKKASVSSLFEIESSKIALQRAQTPEVKAFAQQMIDDHTAAGKKMKGAVAESGLKLVEYKTLDEAHQKKITELKQADAKDFDDKYIDIQEDAHDDAVDLFEDYAENDKANAALKTFAANTLPTLRTHDEHIEKLDKDDDDKKTSSR